MDRRTNDTRLGRFGLNHPLVLPFSHSLIHLPRPVLPVTTLSVYRLATILDNPGEPDAATRYRDAAELKALGYSDLVLFGTTALSGVERPDVVADAEVRRWVAQHFETVQRRIAEARAADLGVYLAYDVLSLAVDTVREQQEAVCCKNDPDMLCPASDAALGRSVASLEALLEQLPAVEGVVLRFGDNDAGRMPHLVGNDIYQPHCARCSQLGRAQRIGQVIDAFYDQVVQRRSKRLIVRAWNVRPRGLHDSGDLCRRVVAALPGTADDDRLILSFKFTHTDFWRYQRWNPPSLHTGGRPLIYELECQREYEGKGTIPNWQAPLWRDGAPECDGPAGAGLDVVRDAVNLVGLWAWVRGGGWGGPFVKDESWIDANAFAVPRLADDPSTHCDELAGAWIAQRLGVEDEALVTAIRRVLENSPETVREAFYIGPFARRRDDPWHPSADWIQDDVLDAEAAWRMIQPLPESVLDEVVDEKRAAVERLAGDSVAMHRAVSERTRRCVEPLLSSLVYAESLLRVLHHLVAGFVAYRRFKEQPHDLQRQRCRRHLVDAQSHWTQHTQQHAGQPGAGTPFREKHFWRLTQMMLAEVVVGDEE